MLGQERADGCDRNVRRPLYREVVDAGRYGWKRNPTDTVLEGNRQRVPIAARQQFILATTAAMPHRADRVDDMGAGKLVCTGNLGLARLAPMELEAFQSELATRRAMDRAVHAATHRSPWYGKDTVHLRVGIEREKAELHGARHVPLGAAPLSSTLFYAASTSADKMASEGKRGHAMARIISIGAQGFEDLRENDYFYVDKTGFVRDWWLSSDVATLVCRPRRFGKTLNLDTVRCFLSMEFAGRGEELFGGLEVWDDPKMRKLQGAVPVVALSFARVKALTFGDMLADICRITSRAVDMHRYLRGWEGLTANDQIMLDEIRPDMDGTTCADALNLLCVLLRRYHGVSPVILLDEYDAPMECAWTHGYWEEASGFMRQLMNSTFKTNPALGRALITGVTRFSRESIFSDLNNLLVVTATTPIYQTSFGFTQAEVDAALEEYGLSGARDEARRWNDGFAFGGIEHIYNPWSVTQLLQFGEFRTYWANTSGNGLVSKVVRRGDENLKTTSRNSCAAERSRRSSTSRSCSPSWRQGTTLHGHYYSPPATSPHRDPCPQTSRRHLTLCASPTTRCG